MPDELTPAELYIPAGALNYWCHAVQYPAARMSASEADAEVACDHFVTLRNADRSARPHPAMAAIGYEAVQLAMTELAGDPELGTLIGYDPELSAARDKLRRIAGR